MELMLKHETTNAIHVNCNGQHSHIFDLQSLLLPSGKEAARLHNDPVSYGQALYHALFPSNTLARQTLEANPKRILLVTTEDDLDAIPWEYLHDFQNFLVLEYPFVRGLPPEQRIETPILDTLLHILAVPSNPLSTHDIPLNIDAEWMRLKKIVETIGQSQHQALKLERIYPPTIEQMRNTVVSRRHLVIHYMGHGGQSHKGAFLCFEKDNGEQHQVSARQFAHRVRDTAFLITLNACVSATPGLTSFSNLAAALVRQGIPYALGMRLNISDDDARIFSRAFYNDLARGTTVEEALFQARLALQSGSQPEVIGIPVLYTSLASPAAGFVRKEGLPSIYEHLPPMEVVSALPRAEGAFQGRIEDLQRLGSLLTGDTCPRILTLYGGGGQGKTALAREAVERFAYAWPDGVWATSLENLPDRALFVTNLARFLGIRIQEMGDLNVVERQVLTYLNSRRILLVLDNAETLVNAVEQNDAAALQLSEFLLQLSNRWASLLVTSRVPLEWAGEVTYELEGLAPKDGAALFRLSASQRGQEIPLDRASALSQQLEGHPLSLRLLGSAFNASQIAFQDFLNEWEDWLLQAKNKYRDLDHRHRSLYACIDTSVRYLNDNLRRLLSGLCIFHAPFLLQTAVAIFDPDAKGTEDLPSAVPTYLRQLWQRGLLTRKTIPTRNNDVEFYYLLPTTRPYVEHHMKMNPPREELLARFGHYYAWLTAYVRDRINLDATVVTIAQQIAVDLERGVAYVAENVQGSYQAALASIFSRLGYLQRSLELYSKILEADQGHDPLFTSSVLNNLGEVYREMGQSERALTLYEQALPIVQEHDNHDMEATLHNNIGLCNRAMGRPEAALKAFQQSLSIMPEPHDQDAVAITLKNIGDAYQELVGPELALNFYKQALARVRDQNTKAKILSGMGEKYQWIGQHQEALSTYQQALAIVREFSNPNGEARLLAQIAALHQARGELEKSLQRYKEALSIARKVSDHEEEAHILNAIAGIYRHRGSLEEALGLFQDALHMSQKVGDPSGEAQCLNNIAEIHWFQGELEKALQHYQEALYIARKAHDHFVQLASLSGLAACHTCNGNFVEAETAYREAIRLAKEVDFPASLSAQLYGLSFLYWRLQCRSEAIKSLEQALRVLTNKKLPQDLAGNTPIKMLNQLQMWRKEASLTTIEISIPFFEIGKQIVAYTFKVMLNAHEQRAAWRAMMEKAQQDDQRQGIGGQVERDFFTQILAVLDGRVPTLFVDHLYAPSIATQKEMIAQLENDSDEMTQ